MVASSRRAVSWDSARKTLTERLEEAKEVVARSPEAGAHNKNARLFTRTLLLTITIFAKMIN